MKYFAEGGPAQQVTQFQPTFSLAQQGLGSIQPYQAPDIPAMEMSPQDYNQYQQYAPTQQYNAPTQQYNAPAPMTAGLGSYLQGLRYTAPAPRPAPSPVTAATKNTTSPRIYDPVTQTYKPNPNYVAPVDASGGGEGSQSAGSYIPVSGLYLGGRIRAYADGGSIPQGIASLGRGQDSMLVHMTPGEVQGLQRLAMAHGGSLTINPQTGLPEAGFLSSMLPTLIGLGITAASGGTIPGWMIGAGVGGVTALTSGSLSKGLMAGLGAYGGAGLGASLTGMGAEQAQGLLGAETNEAADLFGKQAQKTAFDQAVAIASDPQSISNFVDPTQAGEIARKEVIDRVGESFIPKATTPAGQALARSPVGNAVEGIKQLGTKEGLKNLGGKLGYAGVAGLAAPLLSSALTPAPFNPPAKRPEQYYKTSYKPPKYNPETGMYDPASYGPGSYSTAYGAEGGAVGYKQGGTPDFYPLTGDRPNTGGLGGAGEKPQYSSDIYGDASGAGVNDNKAGRGVYSDAAGKGIYENTPSGVEELFAKTSPVTLARYKTAKNAAKQAAAIKELRKRASAVNDYGDDTTSAAQGGLMGLNTYAAGGKLLRGDGDGMSDSIPAVIQGANPQRAALADGEFVIPADVVSHLGNGSTEAGSKRLYSMMDKVRRARTGNPKQGKQINPDRFMPA